MNKIEKKLLFILIVVMLYCTGCNTKMQKTQTITPIVIVNDCDSIIRSALQKLELDTCINDDLQVQIIKLSQSLSECQKDNLKCKFDLASKPTNIYTGKTTFKNSFNDVQKNSNNISELTKLKNSFQSLNSQFDSVSFENFTLQGKIKTLEKEITKNKNSSSGANSPNTAKSGNTTSKASWYLWVIVFFAGVLCGQAIRMLITKSI